MKRILLTIVLLCPLATWAQDFKPLDAKPGLWENTMTTEMSGAAMPTMPALSPEQLARIPAEQRERVEAMMKGGAGAPQTQVTKSCLTREMLNRGMYDSADKSCTSKLVSASSSSQVVHVECSGKGNSKTVGDMKIERIDSEHVKGNMAMKVTGDSTAGGRSLDIKIALTNKWVSSDCGSVKPREDK